jgi:hypothetical protein
MGRGRVADRDAAMQTLSVSTEDKIEETVQDNVIY